MKGFFRHKGIWIAAGALSLALIAGAIGVFRGGYANPLTDLGQLVARPFHRGAAFVSENVQHIYGQAAEYDALLEENRSLKEEISRLEESLRNTSAASRENETLRNLLGFAQKRRELHFTSCRVLSYGVRNWSRPLPIDRGEEDGIVLSQCLVDEFGSLLGVVSEVGDRWSTVTLLTDAAFSMGGQCIDPPQQGVLMGDLTLMPKGRLRLSYLPRDHALSVGDAVVTYATEGVYPSGLLVGTVEELVLDPSGLSAYAVIAPAADLSALGQVFVITSFLVEE